MLSLFDICYRCLIFVIVVWYLLSLFVICYRCLIFVIVVWYLLSLFDICYHCLIFVLHINTTCQSREPFLSITYIHFVVWTCWKKNSRKAIETQHLWLISVCTVKSRWTQVSRSPILLTHVIRLKTSYGEH